MPDLEVKFASEAERAKAIETFDETKGSEEDLQKLMDAKIESTVDAGAAEADKTPPQSAATDKPTDIPAPAPAAVPSTDAPVTPDEWAKAKGYDSFAEARKAFDEQKDTIERQSRFIKEKIETPINPADQRLQQLEAELQTLRSAAPPATRQEKIETQEEKIGVIRQALVANAQKRKAMLEELRADPGIAVDGEFQTRRMEIDAAQDDLNLQLADEMNALKGVVGTATQEMSNYKTSQEMAQRREQNTQLYEREMNEITEFANNPKHPEFSFSAGRSSREVEGEYVKWANSVASAVYAGPVNLVRSQQDKAAVAQALAAIAAGDPEAINACRVAGVPVEPHEDVRKYLDICELLDHRDGHKVNPVTGQKEQQYRLVLDRSTGQFRKDPVRFASLEDAYQHRLAVDGTYSQRIKQAYVKGSKEMAAAAQKRANAPVELDNATGASNADVGMALTPADALKELETIDEAEAMRRKLAGDSTMYDRFEKALDSLQTVKV